MGHNIDLEWLLGLPKYVRCPRCNEMTESGFEEYDIDCGHPEVQDGIMTLDVQCYHCDLEFEFKISVSPIMAPAQSQEEASSQ